MIDRMPRRLRFGRSNVEESPAPATESQDEVSWLFRRAARFEPEDPELIQYGLLREGLAMGRCRRQGQHERGR